MSITTKPYYKYKKDAFKALMKTILSILKRDGSLENVIDLSSATIEDFELQIFFSESKLGDIYIYHLGRTHLGTVKPSLFEGDPVRFYVSSEFGSLPYGVALTHEEIRSVSENAHTLFSLTENSSELQAYGDVKATAFALTTSYFDIETALNWGVIYRG